MKQLIGIMLILMILVLGIVSQALAQGPGPAVLNDPCKIFLPELDDEGNTIPFVMPDCDDEEIQVAGESDPNSGFIIDNLADTSVVIRPGTLSGINDIYIPPDPFPSRLDLEVGLPNVQATTPISSTDVDSSGWFQFPGSENWERFQIMGTSEIPNIPAATIRNKSSYHQISNNLVYRIPEFWQVDQPDGSLKVQQIIAGQVMPTKIKVEVKDHFGNIKRFSSTPVNGWHTFEHTQDWAAWRVIDQRDQYYFGTLANTRFREAGFSRMWWSVLRTSVLVTDFDYQGQSSIELSPMVISSQYPTIQYEDVDGNTGVASNMFGLFSYQNRRWLKLTGGTGFPIEEAVYVNFSERVRVDHTDTTKLLVSKNTGIRIDVYFLEEDGVRLKVWTSYILGSPVTEPPDKDQLVGTQSLFQPTFNVLLADGTQTQITPTQQEEGYWIIPDVSTWQEFWPTIIGDGGWQFWQFKKDDVPNFQGLGVYDSRMTRWHGTNTYRVIGHAPMQIGWQGAITPTGIETPGGTPIPLSLTAKVGIFDFLLTDADATAFGTLWDFGEVDWNQLSVHNKDLERILAYDVRGETIWIDSQFPEWLLVFSNSTYLPLILK